MYLGIYDGKAYYFWAWYVPASILRTCFSANMNRLAQIIPQGKPSLLNRNTMTSFQGTEALLTIMDMPHPKSLPIVGTKLHLLAAGSGIR